MIRSMGIAIATAGMLFAGGMTVQAAEAGPGIQWAQMNSPGDGLTRGSARSGNGRMRRPHGYRHRHGWHRHHHWRRHHWHRRHY